MDRTEQVRQIVDEILREQPDKVERRCGFLHLYGVAQSCALLALKRGLDAELGTIAGMLHDIWVYKTGDPTDHGPRGAPVAREILLGLGCFTDAEISTICQAIARHSLKREVHDTYDELLKDADVLQHYLYNTLFVQSEKDEARLAALRTELGIEQIF
jgi:uncharacterized protein